MNTKPRVDQVDVITHHAAGRAAAFVALITARRTR